ncbi:FGGY family carbohydrate kinase [Maribacter sp. TH_r10]|uniref:FGGY-family carbohydrate kinase n=1 Tax=Maribacter sp. TH_r10 TaxID=3082086 RepID=UPI0029540002|nr:FGGY family carbohydrate kinase [Maribacter sp. TH_r10]MDV7139163.1 FGGY family carbohydrate kinase [Maribacter sp. TH_r10]
MKKVIAVVDIGKTNKKIFLFDDSFNVVSQNYRQFNEVKDDDGFPCDDLDAIEEWILSEIRRIQSEGNYKIKAINFSTHGASLVYLNEKGERLTPLYNYLKPLELADYSFIYDANGGVGEFSRQTASPAYGMLNAGMQMIWLKNKKPDVWKNVKYILHYPQYLSYLFTKEITADYTSIGAHTAIWDFDHMRYHKWLKDEGIALPEPCNGKEAIKAKVNGEPIAIGSGLHDSSSSLIPILESNGDDDFVLLSTGTWIIAMNPFSKETLTAHQLKNNCLCFMTPLKKQVKSSMQFLGHVHEVNTKAFCDHYDLPENYFLNVGLNKKLCEDIIREGRQVFFPNKVPEDYMADLGQLKRYDSFEKAYHQLVYEISYLVFEGIQLILDSDSNLRSIYITGGFNKNDIFVECLSQMLPEQKIKFPNVRNASALGAALLMKQYL